MAAITSKMEAIDTKSNCSETGSGLEDCEDNEQVTESIEIC